jgi:hypothetical protein
MRISFKNQRQNKNFTYTNSEITYHQLTYTIRMVKNVLQKERHFAEKWMELDMISLSNISQTKKEKYLIFPLICRIYSHQTKRM